MNNTKLITPEQKLAFCLVSVSPIRIDTSDTSEIVSQLLFGEPIEIISYGEPWVRIKTIYDGYEGCVDIKHLLPLTDKEFKKWVKEFVYQTEFLKTINTPWGKQVISIGSFVCNECNFKIGEFEFSQKKSDPSIKKLIIDYSLDLLNVPYLWGGKSVYGIDCSGFVQMIFRLIGYNLPRDAYEQGESGETIEYEDIQAGDLAFFSNSKGKINHVGILISKNKIIHASGRVRIDEFNFSGIYNHDYKKQTHVLFSLKRII